MPTFIFTRYAQKKFSSLERDFQRRCTEKLSALKMHPAFFTLLKLLRNFDPPRYRLRIGQYRVILRQISAEEFLVLDIGDRKEIYR